MATDQDRAVSGQGHAVRFSLQLTIGGLLLGLVLVLGGVLTVHGYSRSSDIILSSADAFYGDAADDLGRDLAATYRPLFQALEMLAVSPLVAAADPDQRRANLPLLTAALADEFGVTGIQVGYPDGDYFIVRPVGSAATAVHFDAPAGTAFVADSVIGGADGQARLTRQFFDAALDLLRSDPGAPTAYDPRQRPWYRQAGPRPGPIQPYLFFFTRKVGTTVTLQTATPGVVVAADVSLEQLSDTLAGLASSAGTEVALIDGRGRVFAYRDPSRIVRQADDAGMQLAHLSQLGSPVLQAVAGDLDVSQGKLAFEFDNREWIGRIKPVGEPGGLGLSLLVVSPLDGLLSDAIGIRDGSLLSMLLIIAVTLPAAWLLAWRIGGSLRQLAAEAGAIRRFDFDAPIETRSFITEVDALAGSMRTMKHTITRFIGLINSLAGEKRFDDLLDRIARETMDVVAADAAVTYLLADDEASLQAGRLHRSGAVAGAVTTLPDIAVGSEHPLARHLTDRQPETTRIDTRTPGLSGPWLDLVAQRAAQLVTVPLRNRQGQAVGMLALLQRERADAAESQARIAFVRALSGFAAVSIESRHLSDMQQALLEAFIKLIAGAIDAKSPYTGGHCQRVPELTRMLAEAASASGEPPFRAYAPTEDDWEALHIASWLHDCGKVTTPEYVVDKSTKLETLSDRIHEIRMRFEVLKRDADIAYWKGVGEGGDGDRLRGVRDDLHRRLDQDFAFVAACNEGGEFMAPERLERLREIARIPWTRTLSDRIGISWEEAQRKARTPDPGLPCTERLIADRPDHIIERPAEESMPADNPWGFRLDVPAHKYNRGELYNLEVARGTLSAEERFKINDHIVQTIVMLSKLPYPKHLRAVPEIAGGHHETMDGTGYPRRLTREQTSLPARIMAIADIFEALTASDRPYKKAKTLSEAIRILSAMRADGHVDPDLFELFLKAGVWRRYAERFLEPEQIDRVDVAAYLRSSG